MNFQEYLSTLKEVSFSKYLPEKDLEQILKSSKIVSLKKDEKLFDENSFRETMFILLEGKLEVYKKNKHIAFREKSEFLGEMALLESQPRSANVRAVSDSTLMEIDKKIYTKFMAPNHQVIWDIAKTLSQRTRKDTETLEHSYVGSKKNEEKLRRILDLITDLVFEVDTNGIIMFVNERIQTLGYDPEELIGKPFEEICEGPLNKIQKTHILDKRVGNRSLVEMEFSLKVDPDSSMRDFAQSVTYLISSCGLWDVPNEKVLEKNSEKIFLGTLLIAKCHLLDLKL